MQVSDFNEKVTFNDLETFRNISVKSGKGLIHYILFHNTLYLRILNFRCITKFKKNKFLFLYNFSKIKRFEFVSFYKW